MNFEESQGRFLAATRTRRGRGGKPRAARDAEGFPRARHVAPPWRWPRARPPRALSCGTSRRRGRGGRGRWSDSTVCAKSRK